MAGEAKQPAFGYILQRIWKRLAKRKGSRPQQGAYGYRVSWADTFDHFIDLVNALRSSCAIVLRKQGLNHHFHLPIHSILILYFGRQ